MTSIATATETSKEFDELKIRLKATWMTGDYDLFSRFMEKDAEEFFRGLGIAPGTRVLDVGCGAGQLALIAARMGARVTGCDIATNWLEKSGLARPPRDLRSPLKREMPKRFRTVMVSLTRWSVSSERCSRLARIWSRPNSRAYAGQVG
jgi:SAM-dependent methyltransferase